MWTYGMATQRGNHCASRERWCGIISCIRNSSSTEWEWAPREIRRAWAQCLGEQFLAGIIARGTRDCAHGCKPVGAAVILHFLQSGGWEECNRLKWFGAGGVDVRAWSWSGIGIGCRHGVDVPIREVTEWAERGDSNIRRLRRKKMGGVRGWTCG